ncbi:MAG: hydroxyacid dehydrogenase, partial [Bacteroidetes bacterium]|nr:hydroxyacid dehydrogenase [Bacteroidota bacterium]
INILIADKLSPLAISELEKLGANITNEPTLAAEELPSRISGFEVLVVRSTKVTSATIAAGKDLSLIVRAGAGVNTIDISAASAKGIHVANCPGKNKDAVAELAIGLLIAADRRIVNAASDLRQGKWMKKEYGKAEGLRGKTMGIIGLGAIGSTVAKLAKSLGMKVIAWSRSLTPEIAEEIGIGFCENLTQLVSKSDAVSVHLASNADTQHLINAEFLNAMKDEAILINTSRGQIIDTQALKAAIQQKGLKVALDVYENEPAAGEPDFADTELAGMITGTPHIGASTNQASEAIAMEAVRVIKSYRDTGTPVNAVNLRSGSDLDVNLVVRHFNKVGVLANVLDKLKNDGINVEEMNNTIFAGGEAAICLLKLDKRPKDITMKRIMDNIHIIQLGIK